MAILYSKNTLYIYEEKHSINIKGEEHGKSINFNARRLFGQN